MDRIGQVAITLNGECCPAKDSQSPNFRVRQVTFGVAGIGSGAPGFVEVPGDAAAVYDAAITWLEKMRDAVRAAPAEEVTGPARSGAFRDA